MTDHDDQIQRLQAQRDELARRIRSHNSDLAALLMTHPDQRKIIPAIDHLEEVLSEVLTWVDEFLMQPALDSLREQLEQQAAVALATTSLGLEELGRSVDTPPD